MKPIHCTVEITRPIKEVTDKWQDHQNLPHWQTGFQGVESSRGEYGQVGSTSILRYQIRGRKQLLELKETVLENNLPDSFLGEYEGGGFRNTMHSTFVAIDADTTQWNSVVDYTEVKGFTMKAMTFLFPKMFKRQSQAWMDAFKKFVETDTAIDET